jgi:hypothetical protein
VVCHPSLSPFRSGLITRSRIFYNIHHNLRIRTAASSSTSVRKDRKERLHNGPSGTAATRTRRYGGDASGSESQDPPAHQPAHLDHTLLDRAVSRTSRTRSLVALGPASLVALAWLMIPTGGPSVTSLLLAPAENSAPAPVISTRPPEPHRLAHPSILQWLSPLPNPFNHARMVSAFDIELVLRRVSEIQERKRASGPETEESRHKALGSAPLYKIR